MNQPAITAPEACTASRSFLPLLALLFVGSGCSALIYEIIWFQLLQLVIGSSGVSLGVLLGTFMSGMCLGSLFLPRLIPTSFHPLRVYAVLELGIGAIGLAVLWGMPWVADIYTNLAGHGVLARTIVGAICLLPPTLLMGATLPAIARWVESSRDGIAWLGFFYGGNIAGAVLGCLLAGFYLLRVHDMAYATYVAAALNGAVAITGFGLSAVTRYKGGFGAARRSEESATEPTLAAGHIYLVIAMSGLTALGAEVVWTRLLALVLGQTVYTFSIILAVFLLGLGIGSGIGAVLSRHATRPRLMLGLCQLLLAGAIAWTAHVISALPYWPIQPSLSPGPWLMFQLDLARCVWGVLPAAILWGASFPLALASISSSGQDSGRLVGGVYAANTLGAIVGALSFAMVLVPRFGTHVSQRLLIALCIASSAVLFIVMIWRWSDAASPRAMPLLAWRMSIAIALGVAGLALGGWLLMRVRPIPWQAVAFGRNSGLWVRRTEPGIIKEAAVAHANPNHDWFCLYVGEGMNVTAAVTLSSEGYRYFHGAGKVQASSNPDDMRLQRMLGHISALTFKNHSPEKVLVVACGAGVTAGSFIPYDSVRRIVICDIEKLVPQQVTPMFGAQNYHIVDGIANENPHMVDGKQVEVVYDDGRHFVRTTREMFDVITSDPIDPWVKGCAALNTVEYYTMCREHLNPGGVMALWIPLYESNLDTFKSVVATFFKVFPNGMIWSNDNGVRGYDAVLFGQVGPTRIDLDETEQWLAAHPKVHQSLLEVGFGNPATGFPVSVGLYSSFAGQASRLVGWGRDAQINSDSNLRLQYLAGMWVNSHLSNEILMSVLKHYQFPSDIFTGSPALIHLLQEALARAGRAR